MRFLVVEDDPTISQLIEAILLQESYAVDLARDGQMGLDLSELYEYDLILLDVSLPKRDGISICKEVRSRGNKVPILLLTALDAPVDRARGLNAGADDYLGKPFDTDELLARIRALLRRGSDSSTPVLTWGDLQLDPLSATVNYADQVVAVTPKEYAMLELFLRNNKRVFSCNAILDHLWSYQETPGEEAIRTHIKGLRQKLKKAGASSSFVETVYGIGYRLKPLSTTANLPQNQQLITEAWEKSQEHVREQLAILEELAIRFLNQDISMDWHLTGKRVAHSLAGSLGMYGSPYGSELAKQIEKILSKPQKLNDKQGQQLYLLVSTLRQELQKPIASSRSQGYALDSRISVLVVSKDHDFQLAISEAALDTDWQIEIVDSIEGAHLQLRNHSIRGILLDPAVTDRSDEIVQLLVEVSKHIPAIPVILTASNPYPEIELIGICINLITIDIPNIINALQVAISEVEQNQTHILIVDDDPNILAALQTMLIPWGLKVTTLTNPQEFWSVINSAQPDLLVLDVEMPVMNGLELCQTIRNDKKWSELPIIFLTAHHEASLIQEVFEIGADDFITKPVLEPEIILRILNLLERKKLQQVQPHEKSLLDLPTSSLSYKVEFAVAIAQIQDSLNLLHNTLTVNNLKLEEKQQLCQKALQQVQQLSKIALPQAG
jgi:DNA-binding response OmpR family regulator/HPt (histidine-containing phosphotransfer) domain-containing protein